MGGDVQLGGARSRLHGYRQGGGIWVANDQDQLAGWIAEGGQVPAQELRLVAAGLNRAGQADANSAGADKMAKVLQGIELGIVNDLFGLRINLEKAVLLPSPGAGGFFAENHVPEHVAIG